MVLLYILQDAVINKVNQQERGININGEHLSHLMYADDIALIAQSPQDLQDMLDDINNASKPVGLNMNIAKTKVMLNTHCQKAPVTLDQTIIEEVNNFIYLGKQVTKDGSINEEVKRRIALGWAAFSKVDNIMRSRNAKIKIKRKVFDEYVLPTMIYGSETWALTKAHKEILAVAQRKMERIMLGISLRDHIPNAQIRHQSGVTDIIDAIRTAKHRWAGHVTRLRDNRWTIRATEWTPRQWTRPKGRPAVRWRDELCDHMVPTWTRTAKDRSRWKRSREGFLRSE